MRAMEELEQFVIVEEESGNETPFSWTNILIQLSKEHFLLMKEETEFLKSGDLISLKV